MLLKNLNKMQPKELLFNKDSFLLFDNISAINKKAIPISNVIQIIEILINSNISIKFKKDTRG